jgi:hypothetical protein
MKTFTKEYFDRCEKAFETCQKELRLMAIERIKDFDTFLKMPEEEANFWLDINLSPEQKQERIQEDAHYRHCYGIEEETD